MNMFLWLLDYVTPLNVFSPKIKYFGNTIISLRLTVYYQTIANSGLF